MSIIVLKSKKQVIVNVVSLVQDYVRLEIDEECRTALAINVIGRYVEDTTNKFIKSFSFPVPNQLANQIGEVSIPADSTLIDTRNAQLAAGTFSILEQYKDFGLNALDWEVLY